MPRTALTSSSSATSLRKVGGAPKRFCQVPRLSGEPAPKTSATSCRASPSNSNWLAAAPAWPARLSMPLKRSFIGFLVDSG